MSYDILKKEIKAGTVRNLYLFYGPEDYLINYYVHFLSDWVFKEGLKDMNYMSLDGDKAANETIIEFCDSMPIMAEKKLLVIKGLLGSKKNKNNAAKNAELVEYLATLPEYVYVIFVESEFDKRSSIFTFIKKAGLPVEFEYQSKDQLVNWVGKILKENGKDIAKDDAIYLIENLDPDMKSIFNECMKLVGFVGEKKEIGRTDIDEVCTKSLSSKVFEMIDNVAQKNLQGALVMLEEMISLKEPMVKVLVLIARHVRVLLQVKLGLKEGLPQNLIAQRAGINFGLNKYLSQSNNFSIEKLEVALNECSKADVTIKTTGVDERLVVEKLIAGIVG